MKWKKKKCENVTAEYADNNTTIVNEHNGPSLKILPFLIPARVEHKNYRYKLRTFSKLHYSRQPNLTK